MPDKADVADSGGQNGNDGDEGQCSKCGENVGDADAWYQCDVCCCRVHKSCADLQSSEVKCMPLQRRRLVFLCGSCLTVTKQIPLITKMLADIKNEIERMKGQIPISTHVEKSLSYVDVLKQKKPESVVIVRPKNNQAISDTKRKIRQKVDPAGLGISKFKVVSNGKVVIGCEDKNQIKNLKSQLRSTLGCDYEIEEPLLKNPKIKIMNISQDDVAFGDSDTEVVNIIVQCNNLTKDSNFQMRVLKRHLNKYKKMDVIIETDPVTHNKLLKDGKIRIGWSRCVVFNHVNALQCYQCMAFGHYAKDCKSKKVCSICSSETHSYKDCTSNEEKCVNCTRLSKEKSIVMNVRHSALNKDCPLRVKFVSLQQSKINYFSEP